MVPTGWKKKTCLIVLAAMWHCSSEPAGNAGSGEEPIGLDAADEAEEVINDVGGVPDTPTEGDLETDAPPDIGIVDGDSDYRPPDRHSGGRAGGWNSS